LAQASVEVAFFDPVPGSTIEIGHIRMFDPQDRNVLATGISHAVLSDGISRMTNIGSGASTTNI